MATELAQTPLTDEQTQAQRCCVYRPRVDVVETDVAFVVRADVPGARPDQIDVRFERGQLHVTANVDARPLAGKLLASEYGVGSFKRSFTLGDHVDPSELSAKAVNGVLEIRLPKPAKAQPRQIAVEHG